MPPLGGDGAEARLQHDAEQQAAVALHLLRQVVAVVVRAVFHGVEPRAHVQRHAVCVDLRDIHGSAARVVRALAGVGDVARIGAERPEYLLGARRTVCVEDLQPTARAARGLRRPQQTRGRLRAQGAARLRVYRPAGEVLAVT